MSVLDDILFNLASDPPPTAEKIEAAVKLHPEHAAEIRDHSIDLGLEMLAEEFGLPKKRTPEEERERLIQVGLRAAMPHRYRQAEG